MANFQSIPSRAQCWKQLASFNAQRAATTRTMRALHASLNRSSEQRVYTTLQAILIVVAILILTPAILAVLS